MSVCTNQSEYQNNVLIKAIIQIVKDSKDKEDAINKLEELLKEIPETETEE